MGLLHYRKKKHAKNEQVTLRERYGEGQAEVLGEKLSQALICPPQIRFITMTLSVLLNITLLQHDVSEPASASLYTKGGNPIPLGPIGTPKQFLFGS